MYRFQQMVQHEIEWSARYLQSFGAVARLGGEFFCAMSLSARRREGAKLSGPQSELFGSRACPESQNSNGE